MKVGCAGFPVARARYFETLPTVELSSAFIEPPRLSIAEGWRREAPKDFDFSVPVSQLVTHSAESSSYAKLRAKIPERRRAFCGHFKDTPEVGLAWEATRAVAQALSARFLVFETPYSFYPEANHLRDMYRFFKRARRGAWTLVWQPRGAWESKLLDKVCSDLGLVRARDPLAEAEPSPSPERRERGVRYLRLRGESYTDAQLSQLRRIGAEGPTYVYFMHRRGWFEARRLVMGRLP